MTEPTDEQLKARMLDWWETQFSNWRGDSLNECVNEVAADFSDEAEERVYDRAMKLRVGAKIQIVWPGAGNEVAAELRHQADLVQARREEDLEVADYRWFRDHLRSRADELDGRTS